MDPHPPRGLGRALELDARGGGNRDDKIVTVAGLAAVFSVPARRLQLGVGLGQIGEFSFVVMGLGLAAGVVSSGQFSAVLAAAAITIAASAVGARLFRKPAVS